uniref:Uncharacterized protein n=1 Tax=Siphoviridae sp. cteEQ43 TaxID=2827905 RepID=A0A8S5TC78_9CAUD|nr:MAG TPA: hypothetical protein [Siphoviridae sp. cteEQ43]
MLQSCQAYFFLDVVNILFISFLMVFPTPLSLTILYYSYIILSIY